MPSACPSCDGSRLYRHGVREQHYVDAPHYGEPAVLLVHRRRWRCQDCSTLFPDPLPAIDEKRRATQRLIRYVRTRKMLYDTNALEKGAMTRRVAVPVPDDDLGGLGLGKMGYARVEKRSAQQRIRYLTEFVYTGAHIPTLCDKLESGSFD